MALPASTTSLPFVLYEIQSLAVSIKSVAQSALATLQAGSVNSDWIFNFLDRFYSLGVSLNTWAQVPGLNAAATAHIPSYSGTLTTDISTTTSAGLACISWIVTNFPKDSTGQYVMAYKINADGSRTPTTFTSSQTAGLQTLLQSFIATIG